MLPRAAEVRLVVQAADGDKGRHIDAFDVDLIDGGTRIVHSTLADCRPGIVELYGVPPHRPIELVVSAPGYVTQRRRITLTPAANTAVFVLGRPGMDYYTQGDIQIPYRRAKARYVVLGPTGSRSNARELPGAFPGTSLTFVESLSRPPAWYRGFVEAEVSVRGDVRLAIGALARHLHDHPEQGRLAITLNERGACFTGELVVRFGKALDAAELTAFADRYDLFVVHTRPGETTLAMRAPDAAFPALVEKVKREASVTSVEATIVAPIEIDARF